MTDVDYANDLALLTNTPTQVEFLLHSLKQESRGYVNADARFHAFQIRRTHLHLKW